MEFRNNMVFFERSLVLIRRRSPALLCFYQLDLYALIGRRFGRGASNRSLNLGHLSDNNNGAEDNGANDTSGNSLVSDSDSLRDFLESGPNCPRIHPR